MRTQIEADLLLQNLMLTADAMGLGAWIHASLAPPILLGDPKFRKQYGPMLGFDWTTPRWKPLDVLRWHVPLPKYANLRATCVGLRHKGEHLIKAMCPPNYDSMADGRRRRHRGQVRAATGIYSDEGAVRAHLPGRVRRQVPGGGQQLLGRRDRLRAGHLHLHLRDPRAIPGPLRHDPRARACGCRPTTSRRRTTSSTSATG